MSNPASEGEEEVVLNPEEEEQLRELTNKDTEYDYQLVPAKKKMRKKKKTNKATGQAVNLDEYLNEHGGKLTVNFKDDKYPDKERSSEGSQRTGTRGGRGGSSAGRGDRTGSRGHQKTDKSGANTSGNQSGSPTNASGSGNRGSQPQGGRGYTRGSFVPSQGTAGGRPFHPQGGHHNNRGGDYHNGSHYQSRQQMSGGHRGGRGGRRQPQGQGRYAHGSGRQAGGYYDNYYAGNSHKGGRYHGGSYSGSGHGGNVGNYGSQGGYDDGYSYGNFGTNVSGNMGSRSHMNPQYLEQMYPGTYLYTTAEGVFIFQSKDDFMNAIKPRLLQQIEYYFSANNLNKDTYLRGQMDEEGYVPIDIIANFRRVRDLTKDRSVIEELLKRSTALEVVENKIRGKENWKEWLAKEPTPNTANTASASATKEGKSETPATEGTEEKKEEVAAPSSA
mmetsp:Transcript_24821/g.28329  ORF Transcript_24821/g.28329 Transcript_24821/m.28329 type:complete len:445 (+) Transcript_24821:369-1703(+)